jgi:hypothetical protein
MVSKLGTEVKTLSNLVDQLGPITDNITRYKQSTESLQNEVLKVIEMIQDHDKEASSLLSIDDKVLIIESQGPHFGYYMGSSNGLASLREVAYTLKPDGDKQKCVPDWSQKTGKIYRKSVRYFYHYTPDKSYFVQ